MNGASMFSSAGIGELYFKNANINIVVANELLKPRCDFYSFLYPETKMICGDITSVLVKKSFLESINSDIKFLIATPPCQGLSNLGKNRNIDERLKDPRNYLIFDVLEVIDQKDFDYILIENVPGFLKMFYPYSNGFMRIEEILKLKYSEKYNIECHILNAKDYGVPQSRPRAIIKLFKKGNSWSLPTKSREITLKEAIGHLPSLESGQKSEFKHHTARKHDINHILWLRQTPTGKSAHDNDVYYPSKKDGTKVKGFNATYKRMKWDSPASAVTMRSDAISSQENVHPGRINDDGTYSDARVLTLRELFIVSSLPEDWDIPDHCSDTFMRRIIGEAIPPLMAYKIVEKIK